MSNFRSVILLMYPLMHGAMHTFGSCDSFSISKFAASQPVSPVALSSVQ